MQVEGVLWSDRQDLNGLLAVRSSAPSEDSATGSFAGMHETYLHVRPADVLEKIRLVWASLWSDRSLLYRKEKQLDSRTSTMAVLVQNMVPGAVFGLAFSADPLTGQTDVTILEIVPVYHFSNNKIDAQRPLIDSPAPVRFWNII